MSGRRARRYRNSAHGTTGDLVLSGCPVIEGRMFPDDDLLRTIYLRSSMWAAAHEPGRPVPGFEETGRHTSLLGLLFYDTLLCDPRTVLWDEESRRKGIKLINGNLFVSSDDYVCIPGFIDPSSCRTKDGKPARIPGMLRVMRFGTDELRGL